MSELTERLREEGMEDLHHTAYEAADRIDELEALHEKIASMIKSTSKGTHLGESIAIFGNDKLQVHLVTTKDEADWFDKITPVYIND